jgi:hypothetical protein
VNLLIDRSGTLIDVIRTTARQTAMDLYSLFPDETREWVKKVIMENEAKDMETASRPKGSRELQFTHLQSI